MHAPRDIEIGKPLNQPRLGTGLRGLKLAVVATTLGLFALLASLGSMVVPSTEAVRIRNSLLATAGEPADFDWRPPQLPAGFLAQRGPVPELFRKVAAENAVGDTNLARTLAMVRHLNSGPEHGGPLQRTTAETYRIIVSSGGGYCADYTQVLNGLAAAAGIPIREWGLSFDGFGGWGHAFNEVYDPTRAKWVMIDPFYAFWVRDALSGEPLSAVEFRDRLRLQDALRSTVIEKLAPRAYDFEDDERLMAFYRRGAEQFYLWWGNNVFDYDREPVVRMAGSLSRSLEQVAAIVSGVHPGIRILPTTANVGMMAELRQTRDRFMLICGAAMLLGLLLLFQLLLWRRLAGRQE